MAVLQMKKLRVIAMRECRKPLLELLQRRGVVEVCDGGPADEVFEKTDTAPSCDTFEKNISATLAALEVLDKYAPKKHSMLDMLRPLPERSDADYYAFEAENDRALNTAYDITALWRSIGEKRAEIARRQGIIDALAPWKALDVPMTMKDTATARVFIGYFPEMLNEQTLPEKVAAAAPTVPAVHAEIVGVMQSNTCVFLMCPKADAAVFEAGIRAAGFAYPPVTTSRVVVERIERNRQKIAEYRDLIEKDEQEIRSHADARELLEFSADYYRMRADKYAVLGRLCQSRHTFVLNGWVPAAAAEKLAGELEKKFGACVELNDPAPDDEPPVLLKNDAFAAPVGSVLESFGLPNKNEVDPSGVMAVFYYALFGLMFSDAGYGLLLVAVCGAALILFRSMKQSMRNTLLMFLYCGISTAFWGFMFGGFFGDVLEVVSRTFFNTTWTTPMWWFAPIKEPMRMLIYSMLIGIIHLFTGLVMSGVQLARQKRYKDILFDVVFWLGLVSSLVVLLVGTQLFADMSQMHITLPGWLSATCLVIAGVCAVGIVLTAGRESRSPFKRLLKGLYGLYGITGYLGDILSYSRLLALGLATGVIANVINQMGSMIKGPAGAIAFPIIFIVGHTLNFGINILGAYVHTNRLQFVEFFGKFYEGGGRKFAPFTINSKFYSFKEENKNG